MYQSLTWTTHHQLFTYCWQPCNLLFITKYGRWVASGALRIFILWLLCLQSCVWWTIMLWNFWQIAKIIMNERLALDVFLSAQKILTIANKYSRNSSKHPNWKLGTLFLSIRELRILNQAFVGTASALEFHIDVFWQ